MCGNYCKLERMAGSLLNKCRIEAEPYKVRFLLGGSTLRKKKCIVYKKKKNEMKGGGTSQNHKDMDFSIRSQFIRNQAKLK